MYNPAAVNYPAIEVSRLALREGNCKKPIYAMHKWWARRLGTVFRMLLVAEGVKAGRESPTLWETFYSQGQFPQDFTVLDPFLGGGTSLVEAAKLGARCIGVDIDPVACFITQMELTPVHAEAILVAFREIERNVASTIKKLYRSKVDGEQVDVVYNFWVDHITCPDCGTRSDGHPTYQLAYDTAAGTQTLVCPHCGDAATRRLTARSYTCSSCGGQTNLASPPVANGRFTCPECGSQRPLHELYRSAAVAPRMFAFEYLRSDGVRGFSPVTRRDLALYDKASELLASAGDTLPIPSSPIPKKGRVDRRPLLYGYTHYRQMFNDRQLYCLGLIADQLRRVEPLPVKRALTLAFSQCLATNNMFCGYAFGYRRLTPLFGVHAYRKISRPVEGNVWGVTIGRGSFHNAVRAVVAGNAYMQAPYEFRYHGSRRRERVSLARPKTHLDPGVAAPRQEVRIFNRSSEGLGVLANQSVDLILTDPPYFNNLSYSELSDFYHVWLREVLGRDYCGFGQRHTPLSGALFAGKRQDTAGSHDPKRAYTASLTKILQECHRVAKADAKLVFTFHHRCADAWACLGEALLRAGFSVEKVFPVRSEGRSGFHSYEGSIKWDSVFVCRKAQAAACVQPADALLMRIATGATTRAAAWRTTIRRSRLAFSEADESSLRCALIVQQFADRNLDPRHLPICMAHLPEEA
jgi:adenine-specific DNA methylase